MQRHIVYWVCFAQDLHRKVQIPPFLKVWILHIGVSKNRGTPKSCISIGFSIINHPFWGKTHIFGNTHHYSNHPKPHKNRTFLEDLLVKGAWSKKDKHMAWHVPPSNGGQKMVIYRALRIHLCPKNPGLGQGW